VVTPLPVLDGEDLLHEAHGHGVLRRGRRRDPVLNPLIADVGDLGHDRRGARPEDLQDPPLAVGVDEILDRVDVLPHAVPPLPEELEGGVAGDAREDGPLAERRRDNLRLPVTVLPVDGEVHAADLGHHAVVQPEQLGVPGLGRLHLRQDRRPVVGAKLELAGAPLPGAAVRLVDQQLDRLEPALIVRTDRRADDVEQRGLRGRDPERRVGADAGGADVEGVPLPLRDPVLLDGHQLLDGPHELLRVERREGDALAGRLHALGVHVGPEEADPPLRVEVRLHALETLDGVVENRGGGGQPEVRRLADRRGVPALLLRPFTFEHVVRQDLPEHQLVRRREDDGLGGAVDDRLAGGPAA